MAASKLQRKLMHYTQLALSHYRMIPKGEKVMVCLSGGKDSYTLLTLLNALRLENKHAFHLFSFTLDQSQPGWDDTGLRTWLDAQGIAYTILKKDTYSVVKEKIPENKTYCSLCSRLRRGNIYQYAKDHGFKTIALGHHRDDAIETLLMSIFYGGQIRSMPPKLRTDDQQHIVIRPLIYCQEKDIAAFAKEQNFPIIPCNLCGSQTNLSRVKIKQLIKTLSAENEHIPSNILHALSSIQPSQLMDKTLWDFDTFSPKLKSSQTVSPPAATKETERV
jgi:tRNA 2-thiocytidine biosynthesis protein TtcA